MTRYERILVATDFSPDCEAAFDEATRMAREWGARLYVLHVYETPVGASVPYMPATGYFETLAAVRTIAEKRLQELISRESLKGLDVRPLAERGLAAETIVDTASREDADLIVMGTRGRRGAARLLLGSVAARVIATAPCPVLTLRRQAPAAAVTGAA